MAALSFFPHSVTPPPPPPPAAAELDDTTYDGQQQGEGGKGGEEEGEDGETEGGALLEDAPEEEDSPSEGGSPRKSGCEAVSGSWLQGPVAPSQCCQCWRLNWSMGLAQLSPWNSSRSLRALAC